MINQHIVIIDPATDSRERKLCVNTFDGLQVQTGDQGFESFVDLTPQEVSKLVNVLKEYLDHVLELN